MAVSMMQRKSDGGEYRVSVRVSNNLILRAIEDAGYVGRGSITKFIQDAGMDVGSFYKLCGLRAAPITREGEFSAAAKRLMEALGAAPSDLWSAEQLHMALKTNCATVDMDAAALQAVMGDGVNARLGVDPSDNADRSALSRAVEMILGTVTPKEEKVLRLRYGIGVNEHTLEETGEVLNVTRERIRQIEARALRKLRHPSRSHALSDEPILDPKEMRCKGGDKDGEREFCRGCRRMDPMPPLKYGEAREIPSAVVQLADGTMTCKNRIART